LCWPIQWELTVNFDARSVNFASCCSNFDRTACLCRKCKACVWTSSLIFESRFNVLDMIDEYHEANRQSKISQITFSETEAVCNISGAKKVIEHSTPLRLSLCACPWRYAEKQVILPFSYRNRCVGRLHVHVRDSWPGRTTKT
jgi:hypothetical protein